MGLVPIKITFRSSVEFEFAEFSSLFESSGVGSGYGVGFDPVSNSG